MSEQVEAVDHRAEAGRLLTLADGAASVTASETYAALAGPHATLALVDEIAKASQDRREHRASAVQELRSLLEEQLNGEAFGLRDWEPRARKVLAEFEAADHA